MKTFLQTFIFFIFFNLSFSQYNTQLLSNKIYSGQNLSGSWGYVDTINNKEYALVGTTKGLSIVDITTPTNPVEVKFINGKQGTWRECQTYKNYAYITQDNDTTNSEGVLIYNLSQLPTGKADTFKGNTPNDYIAKSHSLFIDEKGFLYLNGGDARINGTRTNGVLIYDLKPNPMKPTFVGFTQNLFGTGAVNYVHDCYVRNDIMYQAHIYNNRFTIWNISNRANPIKISDFATPYSTVHNLWLSNDSKTLFATHEQFNMPIEAYDISDLNNIHQIDEFKINPTNQEIAHNIHVMNDFAYVSYYSDGVAIFDIADPTNVITVGYYDTQPTVTRAYSGVWGAYGYYKSGVMTLSDMTKGLFVIKPTYLKAARIQGVVTDTNTHIELAGVKISFIDTAINTLTNIDGIYKTGSVKNGLTNFKAEKTGYITKYFSADLVNGTTKVVDLQLRQIPVYVTRNITICEGSTYTFADGIDSVITVAGAYYTNLISPTGKDSIIITNIALKNKSYDSLYISMCPNSVYFTPSGRPISQAGTYYDTLTNTLRCDSIITIYLTIKSTSSTVINDGFCQGTIYNLPDGSTTSTAGTYNFTFQNAVGCDSFITVNLIEKRNSLRVINDEFCQGTTYTLPNSNTTNVAGTYNFTYQNSVGCDSFITVNLIEKQHTTTILNESFCQGTTYTLPNGNTTNIAGTYNFTYQNSVGCDSFITVNLTQNPTYSIFKQDSMQSGNYYTLPNGETTIIAGNFINNLSSIKGCDSVITISLSVFDTTLATNIINLSNNKDINFYYYNSIIHFNINNNNLIINTLTIYNSIGKEVLKLDNPANETQLSGLQNGIYIIQLTTNSGQIYTTKFVNQE